MFGVHLAVSLADIRIL